VSLQTDASIALLAAENAKRPPISANRPADHFYHRKGVGDLAYLFYELKVALRQLNLQAPELRSAGSTIFWRPSSPGPLRIISFGNHCPSPLEPTGAAAAGGPPCPNRVRLAVPVLLARQGLWERLRRATRLYLLKSRVSRSSS
jgi:hypothetical protein